MPEEILPGFYRLEIPLPDSPLKSLNSYIITGSTRNLIIDTGFNREECLAAMQKGLRSLNIDLTCTDFFITHLHADHFGLVEKLKTPTSTIYFNRPDAEILDGWDGFEHMFTYAAENGFPETELRNAFKQHPGKKFGTQWVPELKILQDGDLLEVGDYKLTCIETPGHSLGHTCLYEADKRLLISGDHILGDITPNIQGWSDQQDMLKFYLNSLDKVYPLVVDLVLPGHRSMFTNFRERIDELKHHHMARLDEILSILDQGSRHAYGVASKMHWDIKCDSWEQFPVPQKWFATGEAIAHLRYLEETHQILRNESVPQTTYSLIA
ncbi:MAG: MBL fold metallo-hydrolase [Deltaproteobacteria bacterium]|jgi:glyoxylase-like metal-dependent hydrolase (beta-lactamase superfamily II)|nr:MBL fold metallo-hydrolase [Deltaproteobacteria bacterium]MBT4092033.1 MBL fold metallo-hydrolase [Deltaproteobacteria bacterium]MBT4266962.1 MBL fold metallo-hydrolase [Deltaproteobacteria bacterium]MBT4639683.1 MBL fold metallo-hydrolase [Deltaproteobacteria bacterium]MBT6504888.1 MBL fold metallo-hydrolase [Deltaproteobacteria bacterium]